MNKETIYKELQFKAVRSSGAGGQHVNKVSSKVELYFDLTNSPSFSEEEKELLFKNLATRLTKEGVLQLSSGESRSQHTNKEKVVKRLFEVLAKAFFIARSGRPGPVLIDITKDAQFGEVDFSYKKCEKIRSYRGIFKG